MLRGRRSLLEPPSFTWRALRTCWLVLRLHCPVCGVGRMSAVPFALHRCCPACGVVFERDPGEVTGGVCVNTMATMTGIVALVAWLEFYTDVPRGWITPLCIAFALLFPVLFYRHSRAIWIGLLYLSGLVHRDEAADPEPVIRPWPSSGPGGGGPPVVPEPTPDRQPAAVAAGPAPRLPSRRPWS